MVYTQRIQDGSQDGRLVYYNTIQIVLAYSMAYSKLLQANLKLSFFVKTSRHAILLLTFNLLFILVNKMPLQSSNDYNN